jgi:hypothetical protein
MLYLLVQLAELLRDLFRPGLVIPETWSVDLGPELGYEFILLL